MTPRAVPRTWRRSPQPDAAVIASRLAAKLYGLDILDIGH